MEKTSSNGYKLHWESFHFDVRKEFFTVRIIIHWNNPCRNVMEVFKTRTRCYIISSRLPFPQKVGPGIF